MLHTDLKVGKYWGEKGVDYWNAATWQQLVDDHEVCMNHVLSSVIDYKPLLELVDYKLLLELAANRCCIYITWMCHK